MRSSGVSALILFPGLVLARPSTRVEILRALGIPSSLAQVTDAVLPQAKALPEFILIQDIHRHPEAQLKIAAILLCGRARWGVRDIFMEGLYANAKPMLP